MEKKICVSCHKEKGSLSKDNFCLKCAENRCVKRHLLKFELSFLPASEYNRYLFTLYLKYLDRFQLSKLHRWQAKDFKSVLESKDLAVLTSWESIYKESELFKATFGKKINSGCPFLKTGRMLEELGVINHRQQYFENSISRINQLPEQQQKQYEPYIRFLKTTKSSQATLSLTVEIFLGFSLWLNGQGRIDFMTVTSMDIRQFLDDIKIKNSNFRVLQCYYCVNSFYKWSLAEKQILFNPCVGIKMSEPAPRLLICSEMQCKGLFNFIKNKNSSPEDAILLVLILIWALSSEDLRYAKIEFKKTLIITLPRHKTNRKKYYNREQILCLPDHPKWFYDLQIKFYKNWLENYAKLKKSVPHYYLMLPKRRNVQPLTKYTLLNRVNQATQAAVGNTIPPQVLRKTSGYLHSQQGDASILSTLGWGHNYCFKYTWLPKIVYQKKQSAELT